MAHHVAPDGKIYVDTAFINASGHLPGMDIKHRGFGEFTLITPKGEIEFDRMRGKDFEGQSGRSHQFYSQKDPRLAMEVIKMMEAKGKSEKMASLYTYDRTASVREAEAAFKQEVLPRLLEPILGEARAKILEAFTDVMDGKWPDKRLEYAVMRYKPLSMTDEDFLEALYDPYEKWVRTVPVGR